MAGLNSVQVIGHLGKDPEVRTTQSGSKIVSFSIAVSESWTDKQSGERRERTEWIPVVIFNDGLGTVAEKYLRKGSQCYVEGEYSTRKWQDQSGNDRWTTEVVLRAYRGKLVLLGGRGDGQGQGGGGGGEQRSAPRNQGGGGQSSGGGSGGGNRTWQPPPKDDLDDEIPF